MFSLFVAYQMLGPGAKCVPAGGWIRWLGRQWQLRMQELAGWASAVKTTTG